MIDADHFLTRIKEGSVSHAHLFLGEAAAAHELVDRIAEKLAISPFDRHMTEPEGETIPPSVPIATIRALRAKLSLKPYSSSHHLVFIPNASAMTDEAQNALLKLLEEPAAPTIFILVTADERLLLPTIVSRCQLVRLARSAEGLVFQKLEDILILPLTDQFALAEVLAKDDELPAVLDSWVHTLRERLRRGDPSAAGALQALLTTKERVTQTQSNKRLLLEDLFLALRPTEIV